MRPDIAEAAGRARTLGVRPPAGLLLFVPFQPAPQPALDITSADRVDLPEFPGTDHLARLAHQGVARVIVRDGEDYARLLDDFGQLLGLGQIEGQGLVAHDVEAG